MMQPFEKNGISLAVQQLRLYTSTAEGKGSIPGWGTKILHVAWHSQKIEGKKKAFQRQRLDFSLNST